MLWMKRISAAMILSLLTMSTYAQVKQEKTLLWKISGNKLEKPSYLFGTIHMICKDDALLSQNLKNIISDADEVYFEVDLDNMVEMLSVMGKMKMRGDTTLRDLLSEKDYNTVKEYFESRGSMLPFSMLETYKPIMAASVLEQKSFPCETTAMMEQVIMQEAKQHGKKIKGLESMSYQVGVLDDIPYKLQAEQLVAYIETENKGEGDNKLLNEMMEAYKSQDIERLEEIMLKSDVGAASYSDILLYRRNRNWIEKMKDILPGQSLLFAVGAGHLPGKEGVISLLRKAGYTVTPVKNETASVRTI